MAVIDPLHDAVVIRVVYDGPPTAGKTTSVRTLAGGLGGDVIAPAEIGGRTLYFDWLDYTGGLFEGRRIRCQVVSVPGQATLATRRRRLLESADVVVFVGDSSPEAQPSAKGYLEGLRAILEKRDGPPVGVVVQANKRDHANAVPIDQMRETLDRAGLRVGIVESIATVSRIWSIGTGIRETFVFAVRLALDRVRELMRLGQLQTMRPDIDSAQDLLEHLQQAEGDALRLAADSGLTHTRLSEVRATSMGGAAVEQALRDNAPMENAERLRALRNAGEPPPVPDGQLPSGMIWPPVNGRLILHEATATPITLRREINGDWGGAAGKHWRIHTPASARFSTLHEGRDVLVAWARMHAASAHVVSDQRCVALAQDREGHYRLWQVVRLEQSLRDRLVAALLEEPEAIVDSLLNVTTSLLQAAEQWASAACWLPLGLRKVGVLASGPVFLGRMPDPANARLAEARSSAVVLGILARDLEFARPAIHERRREMRLALDGLVGAGDGAYGEEVVGFVRRLIESG
jgi:signal recognition particle receptor subunit beta